MLDHVASSVSRHFVSLATYMGHTDIVHTYWYLEATPEADDRYCHRSRGAGRQGGTHDADRPSDHCLPARNTCRSSGATVPTHARTYAHAFRLLFVFASDRLGQRPSQLCLEQIDAALGAQLPDPHRANSVGNDATTRNSRLAAIKAFTRYVEFPASRPPLEQVRQIHAIPTKNATTKRWCSTLTIGRGCGACPRRPEPVNAPRYSGPLPCCTSAFAGGLRVFRIGRALTGASPLYTGHRASVSTGKGPQGALPPTLERDCH